MDRPLPWLRYVDADDLDDSTVRLADLKVKNPAGEKLGHVEGFIVDTTSGRPYYVVANAGGWFKSKHFLLPVGHARLDEKQHALIADLEKERIKQFPGFDLDKFEKLSGEELKRIGTETTAACCPTEVLIVEELVWADQPHYRQPDWWREEYSSRPTAMKR